MLKLTRRSFSFAIALACLSAAGCGGSSAGGGSSTGSGPGASISSSFLINGGYLKGGTTIPIGQTESLAFNTWSTGPIYVATPLTTSDPYITVLRTGDQFLQGAYTSTTVNLVDVNGNVVGSIPIDSTGKLTEDVAFSEGYELLLPISSIGSFNFPNGILFNPDFTVTNLNPNVLGDRSIKFSGAIGVTGTNTGVFGNLVSLVSPSITGLTLNWSFAAPAVAPTTVLESTSGNLLAPPVPIIGKNYETAQTLTSLSTTTFPSASITLTINGVEG